MYLLTAYQNLWHACVSFFQWRRTQCLISSEGTLIFQPLPPLSWRHIGDFSKVQNVLVSSTLMPTWSDVRKFDLCIDGCLRPSQHWIGGGGGENCQFSLAETSAPILNGYLWYVIRDALLHKLWTYCGLSMYSWINLPRYEISRILVFHWFFTVHG